MTTQDEFRKFYDELPEYCEVPTNDDGSGDLIEVHKTRLTVGDFERMCRYERRQVDQLREQADLEQLLVDEALRRGCQPDQPMSEVFPEGLQVAMDKLAGQRWVNQADTLEEQGYRQSIFDEWLKKSGLLR
jgi:hypothetical protein